MSKLSCAAPLALGLLLTGCGISHELFGGGKPQLGEPAPQKPVVGFAVAPVPQAALAAKRIFNEGGNAADAAVAEGFALAVTLPSRAGIGGGGACLIDLPKNDGGTGKVLALLFPPGMPQSTTAGSDRPAAVPQLARGLVAMQARYGKLPLGRDIAPAEAMAGGGVAVSRALAVDLGVVGNALLTDPAARSVFAGPSGVLQAGQTLRQPDLAATLNQLQSSGMLGFYQGHQAATIVNAADIAGAGLTLEDLRSVKPRYADPVTVAERGIMLSFLPNPGGRAAAASIESLAQNPQPFSNVVEPASRQGMMQTNLPASAGFAVLDAKGGVVGCATTMNNLFGTGRIAQGTGILLAASPAHVTPPLLAVGIAKRRGSFRAVATGTGQAGAPLAAATALFNAIRGTAAMPQPVPAPGRANVIGCTGLMPGAPRTCEAATDPRDFGLAIGSH